MQSQDEILSMWTGIVPIPRTHTEEENDEDRARPAPRAFALSPALFGIILLCFTLPFISVSCGEHHATLTGIQLVTGRGVPEHEVAFVQKEIALPEPTAVLAFAAAVVGVGLGLVWVRKAVVVSLVAALVPAAVMWIRMFPPPFSPTTTFLTGYQVVLLLFAATAALNGLLLIFTPYESAPAPAARDGSAPSPGNRPAVVALWLGLAAWGMLLIPRAGRAAAIVLGAAAWVAGVIGGRRARMGARHQWGAVAGVSCGLFAVVIAAALTFAPPQVPQPPEGPNTTFTGVW